MLLTIPAGFLFDLATIPKFFWNIVAPFELSIVAPLCHDFLYQRGGQVQHETNPMMWYTREDADRLFYEAMELEGVGTVRRHIAWMAVRDFGWAAWGSGPPIPRAPRFLRDGGADF